MSRTIQYEDRSALPKSNAVRGIIGALLISVFGFVALFFVGCATVQPKSVHGDLPVGSNTPIVTGPAKGHWTERDDHPVITYVVRGEDCTNVASIGQVSFESHGTFTLERGTTFCALPLRDKQRILFHAERN